MNPFLKYVFASVIIVSGTFSCQDISTSGRSKQNHLAGETSAYLLQHAHNPVDWYPWNDEALQKAKKEHKLIIVSIGYSSCHWCHVMERESFSDTAVSRIMNRDFISLKVDREERPDIDNVYMTACQIINRDGGCGWPLNAICLPDGRPVWVGTYLSKEDWQKLMTQIHSLFKEDVNELELMFHGNHLYPNLQNPLKFFENLQVTDSPKLDPCFRVQFLDFILES